MPNYIFRRIFFFLCYGLIWLFIFCLPIGHGRNIFQWSFRHIVDTEPVHFIFNSLFSQAKKGIVVIQQNTQAQQQLPQQSQSQQQLPSQQQTQPPQEVTPSVHSVHHKAVAGHHKHGQKRVHHHKKTPATGTGDQQNSTPSATTEITKQDGALPPPQEDSSSGSAAAP